MSRKLPKGWGEKRLGEVCSFLNRGISPKYVENKGVCVLNQKCVRNHSVNFELSRRHDSSIKPVSPERFIKLGDVLVNSTGTGTLGRIAQVREAPKEKTTVDSHVTIVRPKEGMFFSDFFGYMLILIEEEIKKAGDGCGGQTELARAVLAERFVISYPKAISEQKRIVAILDKAFAEISCAKEIAEKNLANAKEVFESYLQGVFANPGEGWEEKRLGDSNLVEIIDGDRGKNYPSKKDFFDEGFCLFMNTKNVRPDGFLFESTMFITEKKNALLGNGKLNRNDVVMTTRGTIGNIGIYNNDIEYNHIRINSGMLIFRPNQKLITSEYLFEMFRSGIMKRQIEKYVSGAAQPQLPIKTLIRFTIPVPKSIAEQNRIVKNLKELNAETKKLEEIYKQKITNLEELKKSLLQKAFSGEL
jgi:type I restriction enzyme, S subunit